MTPEQIKDIADRLETIRRDVAIDGAEMNEHTRGNIASSLFEIIEEMIPDFYRPEDCPKIFIHGVDCGCAEEREL